MAKHKKPQGGANDRGDGRGVRGRSRAESAGPPAKMKTKPYEREMRRLHGELVALQEWVKATGAKVCIVFEGRDTAGKGGTIKRITERVSTRVFRVVALPAPTEREKTQMYVQRYIQHFPAAGEVVIFDRSWYNRAGVERVMGFCTEEQTRRFLEQVPGVERAMVDSGIVLLKYWLEVSADEQTRRLESRIDDPRKVWKLSDMDLKSYSRWYDYSRARDDMFRATDTVLGPLVRGPHGRQEAGAAQHHHPSARPDPVRAARPSRRHAPQASEGRRLPGAEPALALHPDALLTATWSGSARRSGSLGRVRCVGRRAFWCPSQQAPPATEATERQMGTVPVPISRSNRRRPARHTSPRRAPVATNTRRSAPTSGSCSSAASIKTRVSSV